MKHWKLSRQGFVTAWAVSGPEVTPFSSDKRDANQLRYEAGLRAEIAGHEPVADCAAVDMRKKSRLGLAWRPVCGEDAAFVNGSDFYAVMRRVRMDAATVILSPEERQAEAVLWSWMAADVYLNGQRVGGIESPVYKPIQRQTLRLNLKKGANTLYVACETLGVRDTRSVVGLQLTGGAEGLRVTLPDEALSEQADRALAFFAGARLTEDALVLGTDAPEGAEWALPQHSVDFDRPAQTRWQPVEARRLPLPEGQTHVALRVSVGGAYMCRVWERTEQLQPEYLPGAASPAAHQRAIYERIARVGSLSRGEKFGFPISNMLARKALGIDDPADERHMEELLDLINERVDCSDFLMCGLIRYLKSFPVDENTMARIRRTMLGYRYWMDQDGFDGMCFWSENHCLMFYSAAMCAGELFPQERFSRAGMTGEELREWGRSRVLSWLEDVEQNGFEEFLSGVYMCVTFAALLNVVDYAEPDISRRAAAITDRLLETLALHTFKGGLIAPQGRVYRGVLYPFAAGGMALMNLADPLQPYTYGEGWLGFFATSAYRLPEGLREKMSSPASLSYVTGNARIVLEKHEDWCLTSVQSPREPFRRWPNATLNPNADPSTHDFVKGYNERFHGTTHFQPGVSGYQQHLWYAALDGAAVMFVNHPGSASEGGDLRPGYWHGNGVFPALKQQGGVLGLIYRIPEDQPLHFIHLYCPACRFDEMAEEAGWLFARRGQGYIGFWASAPLEDWQGMNVGCEKRMWGSETACLCVCGGREYPDLAAFRAHCLSLSPAYDAPGAALTAEGFRLVWEQGEDQTQYL